MYQAQKASANTTSLGYKEHNSMDAFSQRSRRTHFAFYDGSAATTKTVGKAEQKSQVPSLQLFVMDTPRLNKRVFFCRIGACKWHCNPV
jgi:hypothetical protein